jgi:transcriptional regulator with XRE-family HTH domain
MTYSLIVKPVSVVGIVARQNGILPSMARMGRPPRSLADKQMMLAMGERLKWVKEANGWNQTQAGEAVGVSQTAWSLYEKGKRWPDAFAAVRLIAKLKISREYLLTGDLGGVERDLAIRLAALHPELVRPRNRDSDTGTDQS